MKKNENKKQMKALHMATKNVEDRFLAHSPLDWAFFFSVRNDNNGSECFLFF